MVWMGFHQQHRAGRPPANKAERSRGWEEVTETRRKRSPRETNGKYVCALNQRFRQQERAQSQTIVSDAPLFFSFSSSAAGRETRPSHCSSPGDWVLNASPADQNALSGMLEQHWGSYICRHAWALCCRSPKPAVNQGAWSGSYVGLAKLKAKYTLRESKRLYLKPNRPWSHELIIPKTHACLHAMP